MRQTTAQNGTGQASPVLLTVPEVAAILREHVETIRERIRAGQIPAIRKGSGQRTSFLIHPADVEAYLATFPAACETAEPTRKIA